MIPLYATIAAGWLKRKGLPRQRLRQPTLCGSRSLQKQFPKAAFSYSGRLRESRPTVGGQDYDNCPANDDLPRWMICSGVFQAVLACLLLVAKCKKPDLTFPDGQSAPFKASVYLVAFTHFCVFIWGTVTVFGPDCDTCDQHEENKDKGTGCHSGAIAARLAAVFPGKAGQGMDAVLLLLLLLLLQGAKCVRCLKCVLWQHCAGVCVCLPVLLPVFGVGKEVPRW